MFSNKHIVVILLIVLFLQQNNSLLTVNAQEATSSPTPTEYTPPPTETYTPPSTDSGRPPEPALCGNSQVETPMEEGDDGNQACGDGCNWPECKWENMPTPTATP